MSFKPSKLTILISFVFFIASVPIYASSISATGNVFNTSPSTFKIERPDGSKLTADCGPGEIANECSIAHIGDEVWGRASCTGGYCNWTCLDVNPYCSDYGQTTRIEEAGVIAKESCAGVNYLVLAAVGFGEIKVRCNSSSQSGCDAVGLDDTINAQLHFFCTEVEIDWLAIN